MFVTIYQKYGDLEGVDEVTLQCKASFNTIEEYSNFLETKKKTVTRK